MKKQDIYKCSVCGTVVKVLNAGKGQLVCCGKPMELLLGLTLCAAEEDTYQW